MNRTYRFVKPNNPILRKVAETVNPEDIKEEKIKLIIEQMLQLAYPERGNKKRPVLVGLAAPQIGISKRIILVDIGADGKGGTSNLQVFINPEIISKSKEMTKRYEGCRSTDRVCGIVKRRKTIKINAYNREGNHIEQEVSSFPAAIFQHEIDHLNGVMFVERIKKDQDLHWVEKEEFPKYRKNWKNWPNKASRDKWRKIQGLG